jgi:hypothetical protein
MIFSTKGQGQNLGERLAETATAAVSGRHEIHGNLPLSPPPEEREEGAAGKGVAESDGSTASPPRIRRTENRGCRSNKKHMGVI